MDWNMLTSTNKWMGGGGGGEEEGLEENDCSRN